MIGSLTILTLFLCVYQIKSSIIAVAKCSSGIIVGCDSLESFKGGMIGNRNSKKIYTLNKNVVLCCIEENSDFHQLFTDIKHLTFGKNDFSIDSITRYTRKLIYTKYRKAHIIILGKKYCDSKVEYCIHEILLHGSLIKHDDYAVSGTGSTSITTLLSEYYKNISKESSIKLSEEEEFHNLKLFVTKAIATGVKLDPKSGGKIKLFTFS